jgi:formiminotetrahydrofolate cyclodeaminase
MAYDANLTVEAFLDATAARQPTPGGGSVAALVGALAAAIGEMVLNYSVGKKDLEAHQDALKQALAELHGSRAVILELLTEDQRAFEALTEAKKLHKSTPFPSFQPALSTAINAPAAIATTGLTILEICRKITPIVNKYLLSDLAVCGELAMATVRCGIYNVQVNLPETTETAYRQSVETAIVRIYDRASTLIQEIIPAIARRIQSGL